jgi:ferrochelatase
LVAANRAKKVTAHYGHLFEKFHGSPLNNNTRRQAEALERELRPAFGPETRVILAMRYWHPLTSEAAATLAEGHFDRIVLLPLYPQYSKTTTGSSLNEWQRKFHPNGWRPRVHAIEEFHDDPAYLDSVVERVNGTLTGIADLSGTDFVFSAHSVPVAVIEHGDPYQRQIERTAELVWQRVAGPQAHLLSKQSGRGEMAAAVDARDCETPGGGESQARGSGAYFLRLGPRGDAA